MLKQFTKWLWDLIVGIVAPLWDFVQDAFIAIIDVTVSAFVGLIVAIPVPSFMSGGLGAVWGQLDSGVMWIASTAGVPQALAIVGAGYGFRMLRKFVTLFQW